MEMTSQTYLLKFISFVEVGNLTTTEDVVDILKEALFYYLGVIEDENSWFVINSCLPVQPLQIWGRKKIKVKKISQELFFS